jgi:pimeloyl-ACP methyl ester carboxylesterase
MAFPTSTDTAGLPARRARVVRLASGLSVHVALQGPDRGPALVLLPGLGDSWRSFGPLMTALPAARRVVAVSPRGHGWSDRPAQGYAPADFAGDVRELFDALGLDEITLVGHSYGSLVAQRVTLEDRRVTGLVLIGSGPGGLRADIRSDLSPAFEALSEPLDPAFVRDFQASVVERPVDAEFFDLVCAELARVPVHALREMGRSMDGGLIAPRLSSIAVPTILLWGDRDPYFPRSEQDDLLARIAGSRLIALPGHGHAPHWEDPARVAAEIEAFVARAAVQPV